MIEGSSYLKVHQDSQGIVRVTLDRPQKLNALNLDVLKEYSRVFENLDLEKDVRVVILDSTGSRAFIAGADIEQMAGMGPLEFRHYSEYLRRLARVMTSSEKIFLAAVRGVAFGGGNIMAMNCDFVFATPESRFGQQEVNLGILGGLPRLMHLVGPRRAWDLVITGRILSATEAENIGLITRCVPEENFDTVVDEYAANIVNRSAVAVRLSKRLKKVAEKADLDTAYEYENELISLCFDDPDTLKRMRDFVAGTKR
jgi:enoyl-CoA hydratase/carnithine racemase